MWFKCWLLPLEKISFSQVKLKTGENYTREHQTMCSPEYHRVWSPYTIPCHAMPCHTIPYHTIPYHTRCSPYTISHNVLTYTCNRSNLSCFPRFHWGGRHCLSYLEWERAIIFPKIFQVLSVQWVWESDHFSKNISNSSSSMGLRDCQSDWKKSTIWKLCQGARAQN